MDDDHRANGLSDVTASDAAKPEPKWPQPAANGDWVCEHGTAMDVHCCNCHSGFIFDRWHECPPLKDIADDPRTEISQRRESGRWGR